MSYARMNVQSPQHWQHLEHSQRLREHVSLAPYTTLGLGGPARYFLEACNVDTLIAAHRWAQHQSLPLAFLAGGSNTIVPDEGFPGLVVHLCMRGLLFEDADADADSVLVRAQAGEPWDALVAETVRRDLQGLECLSGIPGSVGATPIQNVGAYGQEVCETVAYVKALRRDTLEVHTFSKEDCAFSYRDSMFKEHKDRYVVLEVGYLLKRHAPPAVRYAELERALQPSTNQPSANISPLSLEQVRRTVIALRRKKSMVLDPAPCSIPSSASHATTSHATTSHTATHNNPNQRSAGSFFTNPIVSDHVADRVARQALHEQRITKLEDMPRYPYPSRPGHSKLAAGWLIETAGITKGTRRGAIGVSTQHALALVHHGGGTTQELMAFAAWVQQTVKARFGVALEREPVVLMPCVTDKT